MENGVMMQYFEWNLPNDGNLWKCLKQDAAHLHETGITAVWIPPAYKALKQADEGYGTYDLYDLGEFEQKGTIRTKYGTRAELEEMISELHKYQINVYLDAVMNHKAGADYTEKFMARKVNPEQREEQLTAPYEIEGWTGFNFPGRGNRYSDFKWHWYHFSGVDCDKITGEKGVFQIIGDGKTWNEGVDNENGNYDFLMFADLDFDHPEVVKEMKKWGIWVTEEFKFDGMRLDAIKHINDKFIEHFLEAIRKKQGAKFYAVGEYWKNDKDSLDQYLSQVRYKADLFDVPLHYHFFEASQKGKDYDLQQLLPDTLLSDHPDLAVTFVDNHDSQKNSSLESQVKDWFKPIAYGLILLMKEGYPCIFYGDYYGVKGKASPHQLIIDILLNARKKYAYGEQVNYFGNPNYAGFTRKGDPAHPGSGLAVVISNNEEGEKIMNTGEGHPGEVWHEITGDRREEITIDENGNGTFPVSAGKIAVWVKK